MMLESPEWNCQYRDEDIQSNEDTYVVVARGHIYTAV
jgi:hypothetical protein